ncbi:MAG: PAS domain-containing protein [Alphaproteobacteria bacterium]|nr:PAS domain-containing protein [Alphaproteobacteria bacterium]
MRHEFGIPKDIIAEGNELRDDYQVVAAASHPQAQKLLAFWSERPPDGIVIGRDVPSRPIAAILSNVTIYEPIDGGRDCRVRLAGASIRRRFGRDITGLLMSQLFPPNEFRDHLETAIADLEAGKATIVDSRLSSGAIERMHLEAVILPVVAPDRISKWVLVGLFYLS